jgi:hypothetical protein
MYLTRAQSAEGGPANEDVAKGLWAREKEKADLENFLGGKLNLLRNY